MGIYLEDNERIDDLQYKGLKLIQKKDGFCFGLDAVLLSNFVDVKKNTSVIDLGTGTGIIPILLAGKTEAKKITGIEIQDEMAQMAVRSVELNNLNLRVQINCSDLKDAASLYGKGTFDVVTTNPPYMNKGGGPINITDKKAISRHEILCTLEDVIKVASQLLKTGGQFAMVHRPDRLVDIVFLMRMYKIEPKYLRFVYPSINKKPNLILIKGNRSGNAQLKMMKPLFVYDEKGNYSDEINDIYSRDAEVTWNK